MEEVEEVRVRISAAAKLLRKAAEKASGELRDMLITESEKLEDYLRKQGEHVSNVDELAEEIRRWLWSVSIKPSATEDRLDSIIKELENRIEAIIKWFEEAIKGIEGD